MPWAACHAPALRLTAAGSDFEKNGYRIGGKEPEYHFVDTGDDLLTLERELYANSSSIDYRSEALDFSYPLRRNVRISSEVIYSETEDRWNFVTGMVTAF